MLNTVVSINVSIELSAYGGLNQSSNPSFCKLTTEDIPVALRWLNNVTQCALPMQGTGHNIATTAASSSDSEAEEDSTNTNVAHTPINMQGTSILRNLKYESFRAKLTTHFDIQFQKNALVWLVA